jgi:hypothetical protein
LKLGPEVLHRPDIMIGKASFNSYSWVMKLFGRVDSSPGEEIKNILKKGPFDMFLWEK